MVFLLVDNYESTGWMQWMLYNVMNDKVRDTSIELGYDLMQCSALLDGYHPCQSLTVLFLHPSKHQ